jgi:hypothetical protein
MSAISPIENVVVAEVAVKAPKVKKPALPAKLQKFASNIYFILKTLNEQGLLSDENFERSIVENHLFDPIDNLEQQKVVLEAILDQQPAALKTFRKTATARNKPPKAPKAAKAPKAPKEPKEPKEPKAPKEPKEKAPKAKKEKKAVVEEPTEVSPPPAAAAAAEVVVTETEPETKPKKVRKAKKAEPAVVEPVVEPATVEPVVIETAPAAPAASATKDKKEKKAKEPKEPKEKKEKKEPKEKATKKTKNAPKVTSDADEDLIGQIVAAARSSSSEKEPEQEQEDEDEDDLIQTREFSHEGTLYLIDQDNLLYSSSSHEHIGSFDPASNSIVLL